MAMIGNLSLPALIIGIILKSLLLLIAVLTLTWFMRRSSAAVRHLYLSVAVMVLLALPLVSFLVPSWDMGLISDPFVQQEAQTILTPAKPTATGEAFSREVAGVPQSTPPSDAGRFRWFNWILVGWLTGTVFLFLRLMGGKLFGFWVAWRAPEIEDSNVLSKLEQVAHRLGINEKITILESDGFKVPFVYGILRPRLIMPSHARTWPAERLETILYHELAHVKRKDILMQFLAQVVCCIYWINPLAWILERQLFLERERACDDMALDQNIKASEYAGHLMEVLEEMGNPTNSLWVVTAMAEGTDFKDRILSILNPTAQRRSPQRMHSSAVIILALFFLLVFGAFSPWAAADRPSEQRLSAAVPVDSSRPAEDSSMLRILLESLRDGDASVREHAASALADLGDKQAVPPLIQALKDENALVREHVATALGKLGDKRAVQPLINALKKEPNAVVREHIISALRKLRQPVGEGTL